MADTRVPYGVKACAWPSTGISCLGGFFCLTSCRSPLAGRTAGAMLILWGAFAFLYG